MMNGYLGGSCSKLLEILDTEPYMFISHQANR